MPKYFWLNLLMDDHHLGYITKLQKKKKQTGLWTLGLLIKLRRALLELGISQKLYINSL
jgi:hypothetical protein